MWWMRDGSALKAPITLAHERKHNASSNYLTQPPLPLPRPTPFKNGSTQSACSHFEWKFFEKLHVQLNIENMIISSLKHIEML